MDACRLSFVVFAGLNAGGEVGVGGEGGPDWRAWQLVAAAAKAGYRGRA
jgi:hypothetical protein